MNTEVYTVADVAKQLRVNRSTVLRWCERGVIGYHCLRGCSGRRRVLWFTEKHLDRFLSEHNIKAKRQAASVEVTFVGLTAALRPIDVAARYRVHLSTVLRW